MIYLLLCTLEKSQRTTPLGQLPADCSYDFFHFSDTPSAHRLYSSGKFYYFCRIYNQNKNPLYQLIPLQKDWYYSQTIYFILQICQKSARMCTIHLRMMKLERQGQVISEPFLSISAPDEKRIIENSTVHTDSPVDLRIDNSRCSDHHTVCGQISVPTACRNLGCIF